MGSGAKRWPCHTAPTRSQQIVTPIEDVEEAEEEREDAAAVFVYLARPDLVRLLQGARERSHVALLALLSGRTGLSKAAQWTVCD